MGFLDNSGDIILDAVLTDTGRFRLAKGDGTFRIAKFALGDDEINYSLYNQNHSSGSAYYDLEILQSPVLEAFTNNTSLMKSKLISIPRTNLLYLPIIKVHENEGHTAYYTGGSLSDLYIVTVDEATEGGTGNASTTEFREAGTEAERGAFKEASGILGGFRPNSTRNFIEVHQGLDTTEIPPSFTIDSDLRESQYIIEMDNRLGTIVDHVGEAAPVSFVDDDNVASYFISQAVPGFIDVGGSIGTDADTSLPIAGPRGTKLRFKIKSSVELATSTFLFTKLGSTMIDAGTSTTRNFRFIHSTIRITGATTGYRIDIPVRFVKSTT